MENLRREIHPILKTFVDIFYNGEVGKFEKEYKKVIGKEVNVRNPSAGIVVFVRKKWGLSSDTLLELESIAKRLRNKRFKQLKRNSSAYAYASSVLRFLKILENEDLLRVSELDFRTHSCDPVQDAKRFIEFYGLNKQDINTFSTLRSILESRDIYVFAFPLDSNHHEGVVNPESPAFVILNANALRPRASFLLAHEIGHIIYRDLGKESLEERFSNKFATNLIIPDPLVDAIYSIFKQSLRNHSNRYFLFSKLICLEFSCEILPETAIMKLFYHEKLSYPEMKNWEKNLIKLRKKYQSANVKVGWLRKMVEKIGIITPDKYRKAIELVHEQGKISEKRKKEMLFERVKHALCMH